MIGFNNILSGVLEHSTGRVSRSNVVRPLLYIVGVSAVALLTAVSFGANMGIQIFLAGMFAVSVVFFGAMYLYFAKKQPDALRSETFAIQQQLIDRGLVGDATSGLREVRGLGDEAEAVESIDIESKKIEAK